MILSGKQLKALASICKKDGSTDTGNVWLTSDKQGRLRLWATDGRSLLIVGAAEDGPKGGAPWRSYALEEFSRLKAGDSVEVTADGITLPWGVAKRNDDYHGAPPAEIDGVIPEQAEGATAVPNLIGLDPALMARCCKALSTVAALNPKKPNPVVWQFGGASAPVRVDCLGDFRTTLIVMPCRADCDTSTTEEVVERWAADNNKTLTLVDAESAA